MTIRELDGWRLEGKLPNKRHGVLKEEDKEAFDLNVDYVVEAYRHTCHGEHGAERQGYILINILEHAFFVEWTEDEMRTWRQGLIPVGGV